MDNTKRRFYWYCEDGKMEPVEIINDRVYFLGSTWYVPAVCLKGKLISLYPQTLPQAGYEEE